MKLVTPESMPFDQRPQQLRAGTTNSKRMVQGAEDTPGNFTFNLVRRSGGGLISPRHRHNFEQIRYQLEGEYDYDRHGKMLPGNIGYFPEGTYYGPQTAGGDTLLLVAQFGGPSGNGFMSERQVRQGMKELASEGEFKGGVFYRKSDVEGKRNLDAYQAVWEHMRGQEMTYPKSRYRDPMIMDPNSCDYIPTSERGVSEKLMGVFTEYRTELGFVQLDAGATHHPASGDRLYFALSGGGKVAGEAWTPHSAIYAEDGENIAIDATVRSEFLVIGLPKLVRRAEQNAAAAE